MKTLNTLKYRLLVLAFLLLSGLPLLAQPQVQEDGLVPLDQVEMADTLRADGKIYVVVAVFLAIMAGVVLYLVRIDRKVAKLENELDRQGHPQVR